MEGSSEDHARLTDSVWNQVKEMIDHEARIIGKDTTPHFSASLAETVILQMRTMAVDLESFASHAKRTGISMEDVKLCARRNDTLHQVISKAAEDIQDDITNKRKKK